MDIFAKGMKALIVAIDDSGRKTLRHGVVSTVRIHLIDEPPGRPDVARILEKPSFIDDRVLPAERLQCLRKNTYIVTKLRLRNGEAISVPAIPAHRRTRSKFNRLVTWSLRKQRGNPSQQQGC